MAEDIKLRLVKPTDHTDTLLFDRRGISRRRITGQATSLSWQPGEAKDEHCNNRIAPLELKNISDRGLGASSREPLAVNTPITVYVKPKYAPRIMTLRGRVVRCRINESGHDVGIKFDEALPVSAA